MRFTIKNLRWIDLSIFGLTLIVMVLGIGNYGLYEPHEGHFAMVGQEMLWRNDWITPYLNGSPYLNKPPLLYWLIATSTSIFGSTEFAARLPISLSGWLGIIIAWKWTRDLWGINSSRITALMLSVTLGWFIFTHQILIDVLLGTLLLSNSYFIWKSLYQPHSWFNWSGTYISLALCVLTKGLIGGVFPLISCLGLVIIRQDWKIIRQIKLGKGLLLVLAIIVPWFIAIERANPGFLHYFVVNEHLERLLDRRFPPDYDVSKISAFGYLTITACWCFPWILFLPSVINFTWTEWQRGFLGNASVLDRKNSDGIFLLAISAILPVMLFLPLSSRLIYYSIPAIPPYVILCAGWWDKRSRSINLPPSAFVDYLTKADFKRKPPASTSTICQSTVQIINSPVKNKTLNFYGAIAIIFSVSCYGVTLLIPLIVSLLPKVLQTTEIEKLIIIVAIALGTGWLTAGISMFKRSALAWLPLFIVLVITYIATIRGFTLYQDIRSSKSLVNQANICLNAQTLWIFEGSREIGAAGAISYYLNQNSTLRAGDNAYRTVMVLADGGKNRLPPQFPGSSPEYLLTKTELQKYWYSDRPVVFMTDFLRQPDDLSDPLNLNLPQAEVKPYLIKGQRRLYLNQAAQAMATQQCNR
jgi:4-amino-4-deoxy-L-arabinose transferase-like glycosyltransferase